MFFKRNKNYSQGNEESVINSVFKNIENGFFIDVGAHHPTKLSNTYSLYKRGWRGLCIDPDRSHARAFKRFRPEDKLEHVAISNYDGEAEFYFGKYSVHNSLKQYENRYVKKQKVTVHRLDSLLKSLGETRDIDVLSIDTEGTELDVLDGLDLEKRKPRLIIAEYNTSSVIDLKIQPYLVSKGYQILSVSCWNVIATSQFADDYKIFCPNY